MKPLRVVLFSCILFSTGMSRAADAVYAGYYRGSAMDKGMYSFTNIQDAVSSATRIGTSPFPARNWERLAFDGSAYLTFNRNDVQDGPGLYHYNVNSTLSLLSGDAETGIDYTFADWHGIAYCDLFYYGLYAGDNLSGAGLYRFTDPTNPEGTAERLFPLQSFSEEAWSDVAYDGTRFLFVQTEAAGNPGIYQYDEETDSFSRVSGVESYSDWDGLGVYVASDPVTERNPLLHKTVYVVLLGGQSNAMGWGYHQYLYDTAHLLASPQNDVGMYTGAGMSGLMNVLTNLQSGSGNAFVKSGEPQQYPELTGDDAIDHFGPELQMGRVLRDRIQIPDSEVVVIKYAASGTSLYEDWYPDGTADSSLDGPKYQNFQTTVRNGLAAIENRYPDHHVEIIGMGWVQGEADASEGEAENYFSNLTNFVADVRATFGTNIVFALSKLSPNQKTTDAFMTVRDAQEAAAAVLPRCVATETTGTNYPVASGFAEGTLHYLSPALLQIGLDLGEAVFDVSGLDADEDGLPDSWENGFLPGTTGLGVSPEADYDQDGMTDLEEYTAGTDPTDSSDRLELSFLDFENSWNAKKNVRYQMLTSSNMVAWTAFGTPILYTSSNQTAVVNVFSYAETNPVGFFKLQVD